MSLSPRPLLARVAESWRALPAAARAGVALALVAGVLLRVVRIHDMEYKYDQYWMFIRTQRFGREPFPWIGMPSGGGLRNPGLSVWVFLVLGKLLRVWEPIRLTYGVILLNIGALLLTVVGALAWIPRRQRERWLWAAALAAVNPIAVLLHRQIWAQSVLPIFCIVFVLGWFERDRWAGAFTWGLFGQALAQIHMSGFFLVPAVAAWTLCFGGRLRETMLAERAARGERDDAPDAGDAPEAFVDRVRGPTRWWGWVVGNLVGALGLVPWLIYIARPKAEQPQMLNWTHLVKPLFFANWLGDPLGLHLGYSLREDFWIFVRQGLVLAAHLVVLAAALAILAHAVRWALRERAAGRVTLARVVLGTGSDSAFLTQAMLVGMGLLMTASTIYVARHYLIVTFPMEWVFVAGLALVAPAVVVRGRRWHVGRVALAALWAANLVITLEFQRYIHAHGGGPELGYGRTYAMVMRDRRRIIDAMKKLGHPVKIPADLLPDTSGAPPSPFGSK